MVEVVNWPRASASRSAADALHADKSVIDCRLQELLTVIQSVEDRFSILKTRLQGVVKNEPATDQSSDSPALSPCASAVACRLFEYTKRLGELDSEIADVVRRLEL
jgi:hypothetical protein